MVNERTSLSSTTAATPASSTENSKNTQLTELGNVTPTNNDLTTLVAKILEEHKDYPVWFVVLAVVIGLCAVVGVLAGAVLCIAKFATRGQAVTSASKPTIW